jgi:hypothetical protein
MTGRSCAAFHIGIVSPVMDNHQTNPSDYLVFGPSGHHAVRSGRGRSRLCPSAPWPRIRPEVRRGPHRCPQQSPRCVRIGGRTGPALPVENAYSGFGPRPGRRAKCAPAGSGEVKAAHFCCPGVLTWGRARQGGGPLPGPGGDRPGCLRPAIRPRGPCCGISLGRVPMSAYRYQ